MRQAKYYYFFPFEKKAFGLTVCYRNWNHTALEGIATIGLVRTNKKVFNVWK